MITNLEIKKLKPKKGFVQNESYEFVGHHLLASYFNCDKKSLLDKNKLIASMKEAVNASGATFLSSSEYIFPEGGLTLVMLLAESHASIHTYPEHGACFVDFFTCGHSCDGEKFDFLLREYLKPKNFRKQTLIRN